MSGNNCQCEACTCSAEARVAPTANRAEVGHLQERLPAILRYRGLENEATGAARLVKVASLVNSLRSVLDDLRSSLDPNTAAPNPGAATEQHADVDGGREDDATMFVGRQARLVEGILKAALHNLNTGTTVTATNAWSSDDDTDQHSPEYESVEPEIAAGAVDYGS